MEANGHARISILIQAGVPDRKPSSQTAGYSYSNLACPTVALCDLAQYLRELCVCVCASFKSGWLLVDGFEAVNRRAIHVVRDHDSGMFRMAASMQVVGICNVERSF
jgi:hypothetical protein